MSLAQTFKRSSAALGVAALSALTLASAQPVTPRGDWKTHTIREGKLYWIEGTGGSAGGGGNATVLIGDKGVIVWDAMTTFASGSKLLAYVAALTPKPVTDVVETHSDCDHTGGLVAFPASVRIIAHINNALEQDAILRLATVEVDGGYGLPPKDRLPNALIFKNKQAITINGERLVFYNAGPAHTSGDLITYLPEYKVVVAGDLLTKSKTNLTPDGLPLRDQGLIWKFEKNGSIDGWFKNAEILLSLDANTYITGHGETRTKDEVRQLYAALREQMNKVEALAASGKTLEEIKLAMGDEKYRPTGLRTPGDLKECPRGIEVLSGSTIYWYEWTRKHRALQ